MTLKPKFLATTLYSLSLWGGGVRKEFHPRPELQRDHILSRQSLHYVLNNIRRFYCSYHFKTKHKHAFLYNIEFVLQEINKWPQDPKWPSHQSFWCQLFHLWESEKRCLPNPQIITLALLVHLPLKHERLAGTRMMKCQVGWTSGLMQPIPSQYLNADFQAKLLAELYGFNMT